MPGFTTSNIAAPSNTNIDQFNPLTLGSQNANNAQQFSNPGLIISQVLKFAFPIAGMILFVMILWGGFEMVAGATSKGKDAGRQRITAAVIGFFLLFISFWMAKIVGLVFGIDIPLL